MKQQLSLSMLSLLGINSQVYSQQPTEVQKTDRLNVLYIMSDDLNSDMGSFDDPLVQTPNLDRLRAHATRFMNAYTQFPLSGPSRASIMTGYYPDKTQVHDLQTFFRNTIPSAVTLPELFKKNDYFTARVGKIYHAGVPFDIGGPGQDDQQSWQTTYNPIGIDKTDENKIHVLTGHSGTGSQRRIGASLAYMEVDGPDDLHTDAIGANIACSLIRQHKDESFFIGVGFFRPHTPYVAPKKYFDLYPLDKITLPYVPEDDWDSKPLAAKTVIPLNYNLPKDSLIKVKQAYYAAISFMDAQVGKLLNTLEEENLLDKTIIVFQSDHGYLLGEHGLWQKRNLFEHCVNTPLIISVPGITNSKASTNDIVEFVDIYPTIAKLCQLKDIPDDIDGTSLLPLLKNPSSSLQKEAYTIVKGNGYQGSNTFGKRVINTGRSIRNARYRYTEWNEGKDGGELYDYENDPNEFDNLYNNPKYKKIQSELKEKLHAKYE